MNEHPTGFDPASLASDYLGEAATLLAHDDPFPGGAVVPPIYQTSLFTFDNYADMADTFAGRRRQPIYSRGDNPTVMEFEARVAALEGAEAARGFSSGMAAISATVLAFVGAGERIVAVRNCYGDAYRLFERLFPRLQIKVDYVDGSDPDAVAAALPGAKLLYLESPTSMMFELQDIEHLTRLAKERGIVTTIDNSWATPVFQKPISHGVDLVLHSASKYLGGHSDTVAGVVAGSAAHIKHINEQTYSSLGGKLSPFESWLLLRGLRTLPLRLPHHMKSGLTLAERLKAHGKVERVNHPAYSNHPGKKTLAGYAGLFSFEVAEDVDIPAFVDALKLFRIGVSWGGHESLVVPAKASLEQTPGLNSMARFGVSPRTIRFNVGLENVEDLWADIAQAFDKAKNKVFKMGVPNMKSLTILLAAAAGLAISAGAALADTTIKMVEVITSPPRTEFLKKQIAEFEQANPGIKVELVSLPWGQAFEKFLTMVQAGDTPDVVEMPERWMGLYANNGQLEDLGPYMAKWDDAKTLGDRAKQFGSTVNNTQFMIPYGYYVNALFWNKKLFKEAGLDRPPENLDEFVEFSKKISAIPGKYGYCLRGGPGAFNGMHMFMNIAAGKGGYFTEDGTSTINDEGSVKGLQMLADMYKNGLAPKDSVSWGFNETVTGFYSGTCAMLNQDPDALLGIADKMSADDFAVAPLPVGPSGKSYPTLGYAGWAMFANSQHKDEAWKLMATLLSPKDNLEWAKEVGVVPIHNGADQDAHFKTEQFKGWFTELNDSSKYEMVTPPTHLENLGNFVDQVAIKNFQEVLLGQKPAKQVADEWAAFLTKEQQAWLAKNKK